MMQWQSMNIFHKQQNSVQLLVNVDNFIRLNILQSFCNLTKPII